MDRLDALFEIVERLNHRYPEGTTPFAIVTRLCEESGELAKEVNHLEGTGQKVAKYGPCDKTRIAKEAQDVIRCALAAVMYYGVKAEFEASIVESLSRLRGSA